MALSKSRAAIAQLTASGTSTTLDVSASYRQTLYLKHSNGTGTVTGAATYQVQVKTSGGTLWYSLNAQPLPFSAVAAQVDDRPFRIPDDVASVRIIYAQPTGPTGYTLDAEVGDITGE